MTVNTGLSREYYDSLKAPEKRFFLFENSAHSPLFEEPGRFREVVKETLAAGIRRPGKNEYCDHNPHFYLFLGIISAIFMIKRELEQTTIKFRHGCYERVFQRVS